MPSLLKPYISKFSICVIKFYNRSRSAGPHAIVRFAWCLNVLLDMSENRICPHHSLIWKSFTALLLPCVRIKSACVGHVNPSLTQLSQSFHWILFL